MSEHLSEQTRSTLRLLGWQAGRCVRIDEEIEAVEASGMSLNEPAREFLVQFAGLPFDEVGIPLRINREAILGLEYFDADKVKRLDRLLDDRVCAVADVFIDVVLLVGASGGVYGFGVDPRYVSWLAKDSIDLMNLLCERRPIEGTGLVLDYDLTSTGETYRFTISSHIC